MDITLRDYLAGQALQGLLSNSQLAKAFKGSTPEFVQGWHGDTAYKFADAMIKARGE